MNTKIEITMAVAGGGFQATVHFAPGTFARRPAIVGRVGADRKTAIANVMALAAPVLADVLAPKVSPDFDDDDF